jgi:nucleoside-diphosphate-sugar epimerase
MRVFVTGASGHIASAVIPELLDHGHQVVGLARSEPSAEAVAALGAEVRRGDLDDLDGLKAAATEADGVIHLAFKHEALRTGDFMGAVSADMAATQAIGESLIGTDKPFVSTSPRAVPGSTRRTTPSVWGSGACAPQSSGSRRWFTASSTITASRTR